MYTNVFKSAAHIHTRVFCADTRPGSTCLTLRCVNGFFFIHTQRTAMIIIKREPSRRNGYQITTTITAHSNEWVLVAGLGAKTPHGIPHTPRCILLLPSACVQGVLSKRIIVNARSIGRYCGPTQSYRPLFITRPFVI